MRLLLARGTRDGFDAAGERRFEGASAVLVTDPPAIRSFVDDREEWTETPLIECPDADVTHMLENEVRRAGAHVVVRLGGVGWRAEHQPIRAAFPVLMGVRPVSAGRTIV